METINSEYYLLVKDSAYPSLEYRDSDNYDLSWELECYKPIEMPEASFDLYLRKPFPRNPKIVDYHRLFGIRHVFSERVKQAIEELSPVRIGFLPTNIRTKNNYYENHFIFYSYNLIPCMDVQNSVYTKSSYSTPEQFRALSVDKLALDSSKLADIPLPERRIFSLGETTAYTLFHESVINNIEKLNPKGMHAVSLDVWYSDISMRL